jgi:hypothetical protein
LFTGEIVINCLFISGILSQFYFELMAEFKIRRGIMAFKATSTIFQFYHGGVK